MDLVRVACRGARAPSPRSPASASRRDLAGWIGAVPAVQRVRTSVGAKLPRWWRAPDRLLSRHRVGARELVVSIRDRGNRVVGPGRAQGDVCVRPFDDRPSEGRFVGPDQRCVHGGRRRLHAAPGWWGGRPDRSRCDGRDRLDGLDGRPGPESDRRSDVRPKPADRTALGLLVDKRHRWPRRVGRDSIAPRILRLRDHRDRLDGREPEPDEPDAGGDPRCCAPLAREHIVCRTGPGPPRCECHRTERGRLLGPIDPGHVDGDREWVGCGHRKFHVVLQRGWRRDLESDHLVVGLRAIVRLGRERPPERTALSRARCHPRRRESIARRLRRVRWDVRDRPPGRRLARPDLVGRKRSHGSETAGNRVPRDIPGDGGRPDPGRKHGRGGGAVPADRAAQSRGLGDGSSDGSVENASWLSRLTLPEGNACAWVHARDGPGNWGPFMSTCFVVINATNQPPIVSIGSPVENEAFPAADTNTFTWTMADELLESAQLPVWANLTVNKVTTALLVGSLGATSVVWTAPDVAVDRGVFHVDVVNPAGLRGSVERTFILTRESPPPPPAPRSPLVFVVAALIVVVPAVFLLVGFLLDRRRRADQPSRTAPPPSLPPPPAGSASASASVTKVCPRCHTTVNAIDVSCFFCGYRFPGEGRPPSGGA